MTAHMLSTQTRPDDLQPVTPEELAGLGVNTAEDQIIANIRASIRRGLPQLHAYAVQPTKVALVCGGPSLPDTLDELRWQYWEGSRLAAVNGSYAWLLEHGMRPAMFFMVDARPWNARFLTRPVPHCTYFLSSQCAPESFDTACAWPDADVRIWHANSTDRERAVLTEYYQGQFEQGGFGSTIGLRALAILQILGFRQIDVYGMDSCSREDGTEHAYVQPENANDEMLTVQTGDDRYFRATMWQASQTKELMEALDTFPPDTDVIFHGNGLIAHLVAERTRQVRRE